MNARPVRSLCLLGGESSGKTTLAVALAEQLGTVWVPEYGRARWEEIGGVLSVAELIRVGQVQVEHEEQYAARATGWLICDTSALTTLVYCELDHGCAPAELVQLARRPYDLIVLCEPDFDFVQDGCRRDAGFTSAQHLRAVELLQDYGLPFVRVSGSVAQRLRQLQPYLAEAVAA
ncbi:ATP-binding protein [Pelomonas sp. SE-A7]|uniref:ATP-binding protein n=1 Tax=Pelomonas sp. SE-A7 TaxID=3054953 RepID=UPI00259D2964|nr:ATP-binding protein [Pelomonas sp. SE-A7]MDM4767865.1 ATP-binding protein [Pelomonas sp. SE-A7]